MSMIQEVTLPVRTRLAAVLLFDDNGSVLLQHRDAFAPTSPNQWSIPGGSIESWESAEEAACREIREETGLFIGSQLSLLWHGMFPSLSHSGMYNEHFVYVERTHAQQEDVIVGEGQAMLFLPVERALSLNLTPNTAYFLTLARQTRRIS
jgi:8-oxo-dGTP pyrophosphatase MutT (NUDIX family)